MIEGFNGSGTLLLPESASQRTGLTRINRRITGFADVADQHCSRTQAPVEADRRPFHVIAPEPVGAPGIALHDLGNVVPSFPVGRNPSVPGHRTFAGVVGGQGQAEVS